MTFIEAAKINCAKVRRKGCPRHVGSDGECWIDAKWAFNSGMSVVNMLLSWDDLMADDWEAYVAPKEIWINEYDDGVSIHLTVQTAENLARPGVTRKAVKYREVRD